MNRSLKKDLIKAGWSVGKVEDFLDLTPEEAAMVEIRLRLAQGLRAKRSALKLTQVAVAQILSSSQSRVAKMESADGSVSLDLLFRALLALGVTRKDLGRMLG